MIGPFTVQPGDLAAPFWDALLERRLVLQRCASCATWIWGPQFRCGTCGTWDPEWTEVEPSGRVYSWIRTWQKFTPEIAERVPYVTVLVELSEAGGARVLGLWSGDGDPVIGEDVQADWDAVPDGRGICWRPVEVAR